MSQLVTQGVSSKLVTYLTDTSGLPKTGLIFSDVSASFRKEGAGSFTAKVLTALIFEEIGSGVYTITFSITDLDTSGSFTWIVTGASISQFTGEATVLPTPQTSNTVATQTCIVFGHLVDLSGNSLVSASVSARVLGAPILGNDSTYGYGFSTGSVAAKTDDNGFFYLTLVRGVMVDVIIPDIGYRRTVTVPNAVSSDLFLIP